MGVCSCERTKNRQKINNPVLKKKKEISYIKCTYDIRDYNSTQIINYKGITYINEEIESKIKILNGDIIEPLVFQKKFNILGMNSIIFIVKEKLINMSYLFNGCISLKKIEFFSFETTQTTDTCAMFQNVKNWNI